MNPKNNIKGCFDDLQGELFDNVLDLTDNFKVDMMIQCEWDPGKVVSVNKETKKWIAKHKDDTTNKGDFIIIFIFNPTIKHHSTYYY